MACRSLLLKLQARGWIGLPPRQRASVNGQRNHRAAEVPHEADPLQVELEMLRPLSVEPVTPGSPEAALFQFLLQQHHYLGHRNFVGENLRYLVRERQGRPVACRLFGSAAWQCQPRDAFIGWTPDERRRHLLRVTNNTRFLTLPWVRVLHLANHLLSRITRRLSRDWQDQYGHPIHLLETVVERDRFAGTWYHTSQKIHCPCCSTLEHPNGEITYYHTAAPPSVVASLPATERTPWLPTAKEVQDVGNVLRSCERPRRTETTTGHREMVGWARIRQSAGGRGSLRRLALRPPQAA